MRKKKTMDELTILDGMYQFNVDGASMDRNGTFTLES